MQTYMKHITLIALLLLTGLQACKKEEETVAAKPVPEVIIRFGYPNPGAVFGMMAFSNQNEIPVDSVAAHELFGISIDEIKLSSLYGFTTDSGIFEFDALSDKDEERFLNLNHNRSAYSSSGFGSKEFGGEIYVPYRISNTAVKGNDTLEISNLGDMVKIYYQSKYTGLNQRDSIRIKP